MAVNADMTGLLELLVCPVCRGRLADEAVRLRCTECGRDYALEQGVPVLDDSSGSPGGPSFLGRSAVLSARQPARLRAPPALRWRPPDRGTGQETLRGHRRRNPPRHRGGNGNGRWPDSVRDAVHLVRQRQTEATGAALEGDRLPGGAGRRCAASLRLRLGGLVRDGRGLASPAGRSAPGLPRRGRASDARTIRLRRRPTRVEVRSKFLWQLDLGRFPRSEEELIRALETSFALEKVERFRVNHDHSVRLRPATGAMTGRRPRVSGLRFATPAGAPVRRRHPPPVP